MVDKRVIARERSDRSNLAQITGLLRLRPAMTASDFSIIVKNIAIFQRSLLGKGHRVSAFSALKFLPKGAKSAEN